jgi:hypothetical protein
MEEALRSSEQRFRVALQNSPTFVFSQDSELRYTWIYNPNPEPKSREPSVNQTLKLWLLKTPNG